MLRVKIVGKGTIEGMKQGSPIQVQVIPYDKKLLTDQFDVHLTFDPEDPMELVLEVEGVE